MRRTHQEAITGTVPAAVEPASEIGIAYVWTVYHRVSSYPASAAGMTDDETTARALVAAVLTGDAETGFGVMQAVDVSAASMDLHEITQDWPSAGQPLICRRDGNGGVAWFPLFRHPREPEGTP